MPNPMRFNYFLCLLLFTGFVNFLVTYPATATAPDATSSFVFKADILPYKSLPENFKGSDVLTVFKKFSNLPTSRTKYQTQADFKKQQSSEVAKIPDLAKLTNDFVVFTKPADSEVFYDAGNARYFFNTPDAFIEVLLNTEKEGNTVGSTALGIKKEISNIKKTHFRLITKNLPAKVGYSYFANRKYRLSKDAKEQIFNESIPGYSAANYVVQGADNIIPLTSEKAALIGEALNIGYVVKFISPFIEQDGGSLEKATLQNPIETSHEIHFLVAQLHELFIYNQHTGEVLYSKRFKI
ncbi:MAG: hypothetical protein PW788_09795 [Micavibrio sp.]|nr:hypothetical protein [Micavibrio sp.]